MLLSVVAAAAQGGYGIYRGVKAQQGLNALSKQRKARFMDAASPIQQNRQFGLQQMNQGIAPSTRAIAEQTAAAQRAGQYRQATDIGGGGMGSVIGRIGALNNANLGLGLAAQNQAARERGMSMTMDANRQLSSIQQRDISNDIRQREDMERAYGKAVQDSFGDALGAAGGFAMMQRETNQANLNRELYQQMYGNQNSNLDMNMGSQSSQSLTNYTPSSLNSQFNALPSTMGGMGRFRTPADFNSPAYLNRLPYEMGGTSGFSQNYGLPPMPNFGKPTTKNYFQ